MPIYENSQFVYILELTSSAQQINTKPKIPYVNIRLNSVIETACFFFCFFLHCKTTMNT